MRETTLVELLRGRARQERESRSHVFLADGEREETRIGAAGLDLRARAVATKLQERATAAMS